MFKNTRGANMGTYNLRAQKKNYKYMITLFGNVASGTAYLLNMTV
jgi:hypothetical protein